MSTKLINTSAYYIRGNGHLEQVRPGVWDCYFSLGKDPFTGKYTRSPKRRIYAKNKTEANRLKQAYKEELERAGGKFENSFGIVSFAREQYDAYPLTNPNSEKRRRTVLKQIVKLLGDADLRTLTPSDIAHAYQYARDTNMYSETTLEKIDAQIRSIYKLALEEGVVQKSPMRRVAKPKPIARPRQFLNEDDLKAVKAALEKEKLNSWVMATWIMVETGMRIGEVLGLGWDFVDLEKDLIYVKWQFTQDRQLRALKTRNSERRIAMSKLLKQKLLEYRQAEYDTFNGLLGFGLVAVDATDRKIEMHFSPVVFSNTATMLDPFNYRRWFQAWSVKNGFGYWDEPSREEKRIGKNGHRYKHKTKPRGYHGITPHLFRHAYASQLARLGVPIATTQLHMGHASYTTTNTYYTHQSDSAERAAVAAFEEATSN